MNILDNYRAVYGLGPNVGHEEVERHRKLEEFLTRALIQSTPETRWETFQEAYTRLYSELPWLNAGERQTNRPRLWGRLIKKHSRIFEVGSGKAELLKHLVSLGHECVATEITPERGSKHYPGEGGLEWHLTDGVNLASFEQEESFDVVISTQVIEHLHPDDVEPHFANARSILKKGGKYIFDTPHRSTGPHDLSKVFGMNSAEFMHLKEYTFAELRTVAQRAGYRKVTAVLKFGPVSSGLLLKWLCFVDFIEEELLKSTSQKRIFRKIMRFGLVPSNIWMVAVK